MGSEGKGRGGGGGGGRGGGYFPNEEMLANFAQSRRAPFGHELRACLRRRLVKTYDRVL